MSVSENIIIVFLSLKMDFVFVHYVHWQYYPMFMPSFSLILFNFNVDTYASS